MTEFSNAINFRKIKVSAQTIRRDLGQEYFHSAMNSLVGRTDSGTFSYIPKIKINTAL